MPVGRVSAAPIARSLCGSGVRITLRARGHLQAPEILTSLPSYFGESSLLEMNHTTVPYDGVCSPHSGFFIRALRPEAVMGASDPVGHVGGTTTQHFATKALLPYA